MTFPSPSPIPNPPASPNHSWIYVILYSPLPLPQLQPPWLLSWTVTVAPQVVPLVCFWYPPPILFTTAKMILLKHQSIYVTSLHKILQGFLSVFTRKSKLLPRVSEALFYIPTWPPFCPISVPSLYSPGSRQGPSLLLLQPAHTYLYTGLLYQQGSHALFWDRIRQGVEESIHRNLSYPWKLWFSSLWGKLQGKVIKLRCWFSPPSSGPDWEAQGPKFSLYCS